MEKFHRVICFLSSCSVLISTAFATTELSQGCLPEILELVPHMTDAFQVLELDTTSPFTLFSPSEQAAVALTERLLQDGCDMLPADLLTEIVNAGLISDLKILTTDLGDEVLSVGPPNTADGIAFDISLDGDILLIDTISEDTVVGVVTASPPNTDISVCGGTGVLHITDDTILPPSLIAAIDSFVAGDASPCGDGSGGSLDMPADSAFLFNVTTTLTGERSNATIPVTAVVNATATDTEGESLPLTTDVVLDVDAVLTETSSEIDTDIVVEVPVNLTVNVVASDCGEGNTTILTPVDIDVGVQLLVNGKSMGEGHKKMGMSCMGEPVEQWHQCGGKADGKAFITSCAVPKNVCLRKNEYYAQCLPEGHIADRLADGWDGTQLECAS